MPPREVHLVGGTPWEAMLLAPVAVALRDAGLLEPVLVICGRRLAATRRVLAAFGLSPDVRVPPPAPVSVDADPRGVMMQRLDALWATRTPAAVIVPGRALAGEAAPTGLAAALAAHWRRVPVVQLDAGERRADLADTLADDADRRLAAQVTTIHLTATPNAAMNLLDERVPAGDVLVTGSTAVDAAVAVAGRRLRYETSAVATARSGPARPLMLVVARHPQTRGAALEGVLTAVRALVQRRTDMEVVMLRPPGPAAREHAGRLLGDLDRVTVLTALSHADLCRLVSEASLLVSDVGDLVPLAPSFGVPVLSLRWSDDLPEALHAGCARLVPCETAQIVAHADDLLDSPVRRDAMTAGGNPYGDGLAGRRAAQASAALLGLAAPPEPMPSPGTVPFGATA
ncbi:UDP-N-acetylglucosamine 2-epimerase [Mangrovihabitans endophyticus]|uniref:UDP-N-acetylglucosamine 2-epimerase (non-hydrolyzing) n=1 Tax=Mangrovihabitans endophyticus TaxID=1751298 RepID=A0A8J3C1V6_9ACTN|nr:UDP-N-acetylglucosamine 2-epimerase [Mangrovihabitans endophyticus]GGL05571.1 UDP-N-acetyl glucosamine 2-epimerase [Mangrovihabitans endophyticus]